MLTDPVLALTILHPATCGLVEDRQHGAQNDVLAVPKQLPTPYLPVSGPIWHNTAMIYMALQHSIPKYNINLDIIIVPGGSVYTLNIEEHT